MVLDNLRRRVEAGGNANKQECPRDIVSLSCQETHKKRKNTEDDSSGEQLADADQVEYNRWIARRLFGGFRSKRTIQHGRGTDSTTKQSHEERKIDLITQYFNDTSTTTKVERATE